MKEKKIIIELHSIVVISKYFQIGEDKNFVIW